MTIGLEVRSSITADADHDLHHYNTIYIIEHWPRDFSL
jgi:hypothetical protein